MLNKHVKSKEALTKPLKPHFQYRTVLIKEVVKMTAMPIAACCIFTALHASPHRHIDWTTAFGEAGT
jgi:hypothetical protein